MKEFRLEADAPEGEIDLNVTQFQPGDWVDVIGKSKGKGFQGVMKKHNFQARARRTVRKRIAATAPSATVPRRVAFGKTWACPVTWVTSA